MPSFGCNKMAPSVSNGAANFGFQSGVILPAVRRSLRALIVRYHFTRFDWLLSVEGGVHFRAPKMKHALPCCPLEPFSRTPSRESPLTAKDDCRRDFAKGPKRWMFSLFSLELGRGQRRHSSPPLIYFEPFSNSDNATSRLDGFVQYLIQVCHLYTPQVCVARTGSRIRDREGRS